MNIEILAINCSINGIIISYLLPIKVILHLRSINIIWPLPTFVITYATKHPTFINLMISRGTQNT